MTIQVVIFDLQNEEDSLEFNQYKQASGMALCLGALNDNLRSLAKYEAFSIDKFINDSEMFDKVTKTCRSNKAKKRVIELFKEAMSIAYDDARDQLYQFANAYNIDIDAL